jgi:hypothetical protein
MLGRFRSSRRHAGGKPRAHFIHIGKTAGTALKWALDPVACDGMYELRLHEHNVTLNSIPRGERVFFVVRDPIDRFVSGFYSRQRRGRPRYEYPWSPQEESAFRAFATADALATALSSIDPERLGAAIRAMRSIVHVRDSYWRWFGSPRSFTARLDDMLLILWFPTLSESFAQLCELLELPDDIALPTDEVTAHRNPQGIDRTLSALGLENLSKWYASDLSFIDVCASQPCFAPNIAVSAGA